MGRKSSRAASPAAAGAPEIPGCFNGIWNAPAAEADEMPPVVARKSLSERKFSEGFEAPRNSLDISNAMFENLRHTSSAPPAPQSDEIPFGFEFALRKSSSERVPPRVSVSNAGRMESSSNRCRSPSVIARLMGLETLPSEEDEKKPGSSSVKHHQQSFAGELQGWRLLSERREFLTSRSSREQQSKSDEQGKYLARQLSGSRLREWAQKSDDEFLLFDVLPFRDHPQEKQLEKLKREFQAQRQLEQQHQRPRAQQQQQVQQQQQQQKQNQVKVKPESREMLEAIQFLQSNKEFLVKFLQEPNSVFSKHIYDLQALAASERSSAPQPAKLHSSSRTKPSREASPQQQQQQNNIGFSRKLVDSKREPRKEELVQKPQKKENSSSIILLKSSSLKNQSSNTCSPRSEKEDGALRRTRSFRDVDGSMDPKELARQIARQVRANISEEMSTHNEGSGSEPSSRRYNKDFRVSTSLPNSPRAKSNLSSKEGRKQVTEKLKSGNQPNDDSPKVENRELFIQIELTRQKEEQQQQQQQQQQKKKGGKLLKLFSRESSEHAQKSSSDKSPRLLVRSNSVPSFVEEKKQEKPEALDRTSSCKQSSSRSSSPSESRGKFSSLKSSLLGKKKSHSRASSPSKSRSNSGEIEHSIIGSDDDHYIRTFRETEAQLATTYNSENNKFSFDSQSPRFLSVNINDGLEHLDTSSDIHTEKSEQPSPVSVLERGFIEESPSPVSFEDVSSDLQELQMRLERLKLDESGRTYKPEKPEEISQHEADISPLATPPHVPGNQDSAYVAKLIHTSGFANSIESLFNWHSPSCPIDPYLFGKLEAGYSDSEAGSFVQNSVPRLGLMRGQRKPKIGRSLNRVERRPETLHRQMLFDVVNEVLSKRFQYLWNDQPWHEIGRQGINPVPSGKHLAHEVEREVELFRHEYDRGEYPLENLVERDVNRGGGGGGSQWMETREELRKITSQVEASIFNGLVEELASSFLSSF